jgi:hypothetical protein
MSRATAKYRQGVTQETEGAAPSDVLAEWQSLRGEIERRSNVQQALFVLSLTTVSIVSAVATKTSGREEQGTLLLLLPFVLYAFARLWIDHHKSIAGIGSYIRTEIEPRSNLRWETYHDGRAPERMARKWNLDFFTAQAVVFVTPGVVALIAGVLLAHPWKAISTPYVAIWLLVAVSGAALYLNWSGWKELIWPQPTEVQSDFDVFRDLFRTSIRVRMDWNRLEHLSPAIKHEVLASTDPLTDWYFPWYRHPDGSPGSYEDASARPTPLAEAASIRGSLADEIDDLGRSLDATRSKPLQFLVAAYRVNGGPTLVLDGNHRLAACIRRSLPFVVAAFVIDGTRDPNIVPDLAHLPLSQSR